jgi:hypothetical protein
MLKTIFNWFTGKPVPGTTAPDVKPEAAPYKVEAPAPTPVHAAPVEQPVPVAEKKPAVRAKTVRAKKAPVPKAPATAITAVPKPKRAPAKKPVVKK